MTLSEEGKAIKVVDRRMFTPEGELRPEYRELDNAPPPSPVKEAPPSEGAGPASPPEAKGGGEASEDAVFVQMVQSLATTTLAALGHMPDPVTGRARVDPQTARQMIDWLGAMERKTRGNLSFPEADLLTRVLYELRMAYVEATRPPAAR